MTAFSAGCSADLHMHSRHSDGSCSVEELVARVRAAGVAVFALTDHDTVEGIAEARRLSAQAGLTLISGVEVSTRLGDHELHILGYGVDEQDATFRARLAEQSEARRGRMSQIVVRLNELGIAITEADVERAAAGAVPGRPHVARALVGVGAVRDTDEAFRRFLGDGGPAQIRKNVPSPREAIAWIHSAGGRAVWAHPLARPVRRVGGFVSLARELRAQGLDGLEEVHPAHFPEARRRIRRVARELGYALTGGSDFHGDASPGVQVGVGRGTDRVDAAVVEALLA
jgi:predicted metal-dependent phosphoesterase TrpH